MVDDNITELAVALAAAVQARLPQADLGDLAADLARALRQHRQDASVAERSATVMARVSACLPARLIMERRMGPDEAAPLERDASSVAPTGTEQGSLQDLPPIARSMPRPRDARSIAMARARLPLRPLPPR